MKQGSRHLHIKDILTEQFVNETNSLQFSKVEMTKNSLHFLHDKVKGNVHEPGCL